MRPFLCYFVILSSLLSAQGVITAVAGGGTVLGAPPTSQSALSARFRGINGVAVDTAGNVYASDSISQQVVRISPQGVLTIVAGNGLQGFSGDGGAAVNASLSSPNGLATDTSGNLYIADRLNNRVRKVSRDGVITTVAGNGSLASSGDSGPALAAGLNGPVALALDALGTLYIVENGKTRRVTTDGNITTYVAIGGSGIALDARGNLYLTAANVVRKVDTGGNVTIVAGGSNTSSLGDGGPATSAGVITPYGVAVDGAGNLYFSEPRYPIHFGKIPNLANERIRKVTPDGTINTLAGSATPFYPFSCGFTGDGGRAAQAQLCDPLAVAVDAAGNVYFADSGNGRLRQVTPAGVINTIAGGGFQTLSGQSLDPLADIGGPATSAVLSNPLAAFPDSSGNLYIADTARHRIVRVDRTGTLRLVAGNGQPGYAGDNGPATVATFRLPSGIFVDRLGNIYIADAGNAALRKIDSSGTIRTVATLTAFSDAALANGNLAIGIVMDAAGSLYVADRAGQQVLKIDSSGSVTTFAGQSGVFGGSGDGGPATSALLSVPVGLALDSSGNLYIADSHNGRVRKVATNGTITTVAGSGPGSNPDTFSCLVLSGNGGPATSASLCGPQGVALDAAGNLYITENGAGARIRKVDASGTISVFAGVNCSDSSGQNCPLNDGGNATNATFLTLSLLVFDADGNLLVADSGSNRIRKILFVAPTFSVSRSQLTFTAIQGGRTPTDLRVQVLSSLTSLNWGVTADTAAWLTLDPNGGLTPGSFTVHVNAATLSPGTYQTTIRVRASLASPQEVSIPVTLTVQPSQPARLVVEPSAFLFQSPSPAAAPSSQTLIIANAGSGSLTWTASATTANGGNWLSVTPASGTTTGAQPVAALVQVSLSGLQPGVYNGTVTVTGGDGSTLTLIVTHVVRDDAAFLEPTHTALQFTAVAGSARVLQQCFGLISHAVSSGGGVGGLVLGLDRETLSGGSWLDVATVGECREAGGNLLGIKVLVHPAGLTAGQYSGLVRVRANNDLSAVVSVRLQVLAAGTNPPVQIQPTGMIFASQIGGTSPPSQTVRFTVVGPNPSGITTTLQTYGGNSFFLSPLGASNPFRPGDPVFLSLLPGDPVFVPVQPQIGPQVGQYRGTYNLQSSDGTLRTLEVLYLIVPAGCQPRQLLMMHRSLSAGFAARTGQPVAIELQLAHECGDVVKDGTVVVEFSSGDPPLTLTNAGNGLYIGVWAPIRAAANVTVTARATHAQLTATDAPVDGRVDADATAPLLFPGGSVSGADFAPGLALAPGGIMSLFGQSLSATAQASALPLPRTLGGTTINIDGIDVPLFYSSSGQINAQVPVELTPNRKHAVVAKVGTTVTVPDSVVVAAARPAVFTVSQDGKGQGAILNTNGVLVGSNSPAAAGDVVAVYCTGLGATQPAVGSGLGAPSAEPLARVILPVTATVGGVPATVSFAGLAPGFAGLYQVNVQIPSGVALGTAVPLVLFQHGMASNTTTLAIR